MNKKVMINIVILTLETSAVDHKHIVIGGGRAGDMVDDGNRMQSDMILPTTISLAW